jgi:hypothetical protein
VEIFSEHGNGPSGAIKARNLLTKRITMNYPNTSFIMELINYLLTSDLYPKVPISRLGHVFLLPSSAPVYMVPGENIFNFFL